MTAVHRLGVAVVKVDLSYLWSNATDTAKRLRNSAQGCADRGYPGTWTFETVNPNGVAAGPGKISCESGTTPSGLMSIRPSFPRVAAMRGNPGLSYVTASRYKNSGKQNGVSKSSKTKVFHEDVDDDLDALFRLPLAEFTGARNTLAARLKKSGRGDEAARVKALAKPSVSAWAVNQLYWNHRKAFDQLITSGERFHKAQTAGKVADMRAALDARREGLSQLSDIAASLLRDAGQNPVITSLDTIRRITATLEAMSAMSASGSHADAPRPGRLTHDVDPPGFESFGSFVPSTKSVPTCGIAGASKSANRKKTNQPTNATGIDLATTTARRKLVSVDNKREEARKARIAAAKVSLQDAKRSLTAAQARAQRLEAAQKKADAEEKRAEKQKRDAEANMEKAKSASEFAAQRARSVAVEIEEAAEAVDDAELAVEKASKELEALVRES